MIRLADSSVRTTLDALQIVSWSMVILLLPVFSRILSASPTTRKKRIPKLSYSENRGTGYYVSVGWNSSTGLPEGSSRMICEPPGPVMMSLRNLSPTPRRRSTSAARSSTCM